jgi:hypothetical protein
MWQNPQLMRCTLTLILLLPLGACQQTRKPLPDYVEKTKNPPFKPPEPSKKNWDWVQLTSDEWLKGEINYVRDYTLEIDSDELDELQFEWRKIKVLKSPRYLSMLLDNQAELHGPVMVKDEQVVVKQKNEFYVFARPHLMTIVPGGQTERSFWGGKLSYGFTLRTGNTDQLDTSLAFKVRRRAPRSRIMVDYLGTFGKVNGEETISNQRLTGSWNLYVARRWYVTPFAFELYRDPFQNIDLRATPLVGAGYYIFKRGLGKQAVVDWDVGAMLGYRRTDFQSGEETSTTATVVLETNLDWDITPKLEWQFSYDIQIGVPDTSDTNQNVTTTLSWDVWKDFDLDFTFVWNFVGQPAPDENDIVPVQSDIRMVFGIGWEF